MVDIVAARAEIQKVVSFLTNRFGSEAEVFDHLTLALSHLREEPPRVEETAVAVPDLEPNDGANGELPAIEEVATAELIQPDIEVSPEAPAPKKARRQNRRRKGTRT